MAEHKLFKILLGQGPRPSFKWMLFSWIGGFLGIFLIEQIGRLADLGDRASLFLIGSFGASAVLVYGAPQAPFSQPRNLIGGHCLSALIGVTVFFAPWRPGYPCLSSSSCPFHFCNATHRYGASSWWSHRPNCSDWGKCDP